MIELQEATKYHHHELLFYNTSSIIPGKTEKLRMQLKDDILFLIITNICLQFATSGRIRMQRICLIIIV